MTSRYTSEFGPNVEQILCSATRIVRGRVPRGVRDELMAAREGWRSGQAGKGRTEAGNLLSS